MSTTGQNRVQRIINEGYDFKLGQYIGDGFNIFHKNLGGFIGFFILSFIISFVVLIIPIVNIFSAFILVPLFAGFFIVANKVRNNEHYEFGDFFKGFEKIGPLSIWILLSFVLSLLLMLPYLMYVGSVMMPMIQAILDGVEPDPEVIIEASENINIMLAYLLLLPSLYFGIAWSWGFYFVIFFKMSAWEALESSRKIITKKWFFFLLFGIIIYVISIAGFIAIGIGLLYTIPAMMLANFAAFADVIGLGDDEINDVQDSILDHLIEE